MHRSSLFRVQHHMYHQLSRRNQPVRIKGREESLPLFVSNSSRRRQRSFSSNNSNNNIYINSDRSSKDVDSKLMLGFTTTCKPTIKELRMAYFEAAKQCHPDVVMNNKDKSQQYDFRDITDAYEHLLKRKHLTTSSDDPNDEYQISLEEEQYYRAACEQVLGISAEVVEESKQNPMFRHWLDGNTDAAQHWRAFFSNHGGLAQKLRVPVAYLESSSRDDETKPKVENRRKRVRK